MFLAVTLGNDASDLGQTSGGAEKGGGKRVRRRASATTGTNGEGNPVITWRDVPQAGGASKTLPQPGRFSFKAERLNRLNHEPHAQPDTQKAYRTNETQQRRRRRAAARGTRQYAPPPSLERAKPAAQLSSSITMIRDVVQRPKTNLVHERHVPCRVDAVEVLLQVVVGAVAVCDRA